MTKPSQWFLYAPVAALPLLAAVVLNTPAMQQNLLERADGNLRKAGLHWAKLVISGRDAAVGGDAPNAEEIGRAVEAVANTYGVRLVRSGARVVQP